jgi:hypothetical protein
MISLNYFKGSQREKTTTTECSGAWEIINVYERRLGRFHAGLTQFVADVISYRQHKRKLPFFVLESIYSTIYQSDYPHISPMYCTLVCMGSGHKKRTEFHSEKHFLFLYCKLIYLKFECVQRGLLFGLLSFINGFFFFKFQSVVAGLCIVSLILRVTARVLLYILYT